MTPHKKLVKQCDDLWIEIIKLKAGYRSEISGKTRDMGYALASHHIVGKPNYTLRYLCFENGICLEAEHEHHWGCHHGSQALKERIRKQIQRARGEDVFERLSLLKNNQLKTGVDIRVIKMFLQKELKKLKEEKRAS